MTNPAGLIVRPSAHDVDETVRRLRAAVEAAGITVFAEVDHGANATAAGMALAPNRLVIFGAGRGGTPLMQASPTAGIDLPLKALVWAEASGTVCLGYNDIAWVAERHGIVGVDGPLAAMAAGLARLAEVATG